MSNYPEAQLIQTPYGKGVAYFHSGGQLTIEPAYGLEIGHNGRPVAVTRDTDGKDAAFVINTVGYGYFYAEINDNVHSPAYGQPVPRFPMFDKWSDSARKKIAQWVTENYAEIMTPVKRAECDLAQARDKADRLEQAMLKAQAEWQDAEREASEAYQRVADAKVGA